AALSRGRRTLPAEVLAGFRGPGHRSGTAAAARREGTLVRVQRGPDPSAAYAEPRAVAGRAEASLAACADHVRADGEVLRARARARSGERALRGDRHRRRSAGRRWPGR